MMSGYTAMLCLLPAFLAAITSAFGLRAAYVRSSRAVSVWSEGVAVLLSSDLLLSCFKLRERAAGHEDAPFFLYVHILLLAAATCLILLSLYQLRSDAVTKRGLLRASLLLAAVLLDFGAAGLPRGIALAAIFLVLRAGLAWHHARPAARVGPRGARHPAGRHPLRARRWPHRPGEPLHARLHGGDSRRP